MEISVEEALKGFGLSEKEIKVYLALLRQSNLSVAQIAKQTKINRITVYDVLKYLLSKGIVSTIIKNGIKYFIASDPKTLVSILEEKKQKIESILPDLEAEVNQINTEPRMEFYSGKDGMKSVMGDIIKSGLPLKCFSSEYGISKFLKYFVPNFIKNRVKAGINIKHLTGSEERYKIWKSKDKQELRQTKFLEELKIPSHIYVYGNNVSIMDIKHENPTAILIENENFAKTMGAIHSILWKKAK